MAKVPRRDVRLTLYRLGLGPQHGHMTTTARTRTIRDAVRTFNKYVLNPAMRQVAGRRHWYAGLIHHTGRRTGKTYATPVVIERFADGVVIPLPYGADVDWLRNAIAAGHVTVTMHGETFGVIDPHIVGPEIAATHLSARRAQGFRRLGVDTFVTFAIAPNAQRDSHDH